MSTAVLSGKVRETKGKSTARAARRENMLPGVIYGLKDNVSFLVTEKELRKILLREGRNTLIDISLEGDSQPGRKVVLKEHQTHPLKDNWQHVDFYEVDMDKKITVKIPIILIGHSPGEKQDGRVNHIMKDLEVECLPGNIIDKVEINMPDVVLGQVIHLSDLKLPNTITVLEEEDLPIVSVMLEKEKAEKAEGEEEEGEEAKAEAAGEDKDK